jgi:hypothetical protein
MMDTVAGQPLAMVWITMNLSATTTAGGDPVIMLAHHRPVGMIIRRDRIHIQPPITQHRRPDPFRRFQPSRAVGMRAKGVRAVTNGRLELFGIPIAIEISYLKSALGSFAKLDKMPLKNIIRGGEDNTF